MSDIKKVIPIIPSLEPDEKLIKIVDELHDNGFEMVIVVDDGSSKKDIFNIIKEKDYCILLTHEYNKGKGEALKTAFQYYKDNFFKDYSGVVCLDSDGQHLVSDVINISNIMLNNDLFVLGTRNFDTKETPKRNKTGNRLTSNIFNKIYGVYLKDTQTGLRAIPNRLIDMHLKTDGSRFEYELNILIDLVKMKEKILQIDIQTVYLKDSNKKSHFHVIRDSYRVYKVLFLRK